jgi:hypothetical protein
MAKLRLLRAMASESALGASAGAAQAQFAAARQAVNARVKVLPVDRKVFMEH